MQKITHLHIPKCGGTSLLAALNRCYEVQRTPNNYKLGRQYRHKKTDVVLSGHFPFGVVKSQSDYITFLRQPIDRLMSFYYYITGRPSSNVWKQKIGNMTLANFVRSSLHDNEMTRYAAGLQDIGIGKKEPITESHLETAIQNLEGFAFVGIMENYSNDFRRLGATIGAGECWGTLDHKLKTKNPRHESMTGIFIELANSRLGFDTKLYNHFLLKSPTKYQMT